MHLAALHAAAVASQATMCRTLADAEATVHADAEAAGRALAYGGDIETYTEAWERWQDVAAKRAAHDAALVALKRSAP